jgi:hypothetical protein
VIGGGLGVPRSVNYAWRSASSPEVSEERVSKADLDDGGGCGRGLRVRKHGLPGVKRCGPALSLEAFGSLER